MTQLFNIRSNVYAKAILNGLLVYAITAIVDGAFWLVPTAIHFWMIMGFGNWIIRNHNIKRK